METARKETRSFLPPAGFLALPYRNGILFHWEPAGPPGTTYRIRYKAIPGSQENSFTAEGRTIFVHASDFLLQATALLLPSKQFIPMAVYQSNPLKFIFIRPKKQIHP
jgi:hypothetical protein